MTTELLPIPPVDTATDPIASGADLRQRWRALMGPLGFGERLLRFAFVGPDRCMMKVLSEMPIGANPPPGDVDQLMSALRELVSDLGAGTTVALLLTRPGVGGISGADRRWAAALTDAAQRFDVPIEPIFRANDEAIVSLGEVAVRR
ncbi:hypothetical protein [Mycolicibacterium sp.]|uniref:hypothetical protein n=1 Tax=Mycolicibacterium sp. TaxID=2320850 RepID=UPI001A31EF1C|nr:hypothetical protein [Mycolicibacterium sp.]MBJ7338457.1 hypothetical protein [Mycolicibacterium sp.]